MLRWVSHIKYIDQFNNSVIPSEVYTSMGGDFKEDHFKEGDPKKETTEDEDITPVIVVVQLKKGIIVH